MPGMVNRRGARLGSLLWLILLLGGGPGVPQALAKGENEYKAGQQAEQRGDYDEAFRQYQIAAQAEPQNPQYLLGLERARVQAASLHVDRGHQLREQGNLQE